MSRASTAYKTAAAESAIKTAWLIALPSIPKANDPSTTIALYFTNWHENITLGGKTYIPSPLSVDPPKVNKAMEKTSGTLALCNLTSALSGYAKEYLLMDAVVGAQHAVKTATGWVTIDAFVGVLDAPSISESEIVANFSKGRSVHTLVPRRLYWSRDFPHLPSAKNPRELSVK